MRYNNLTKCILKYIYGSLTFLKYFQRHVQYAHLAIILLALKIHAKTSTTFVLITFLYIFFPIPISSHKTQIQR